MDRPLKITFLMMRPGVEGGVRVVAIYAEALARAGHEVTIVCTQKPVEGMRARLSRLVKSRSLSPVYPPIRSHLDPLPLIAVPGKPVTLKHVPHGGPILADEIPDGDVVVATWWETAEWQKELPASKGVPAYLIQHDERVFPGMDPERQRRVEATWRQPAARVVVAQWLADLLEEHGASPAHVLENAVDPHRFYADPRGKQARPTVGYMHSPVAFKGVDLIKQAIELASDRLPELVVRAFGHGDPSEGSGLPRGVETHYTQDPDRDVLRSIYASCDAWLFGSRCEGFGLPLLEAMACRTPVIATPAGAAPQLIDDTVGRLLPAPATRCGGLEDQAVVAAMADAIVALTTRDEADWRRTSENAYVRSAEHRWDDASKRFEAVLRDAAERDGREEPAKTADSGEPAKPAA